MIRVSNRKCISRLSQRSLRASRARNSVAVLAIALTTVLFTALFTIAMSFNASYQEANFRQAGGYAHGTFKYLTREQYEELKGDPLIQEYGLRRFIGMPEDVPFNKTHVEIGYSDAKQAHWMYCDPAEGRLPEEGTDEAAADRKVLELLGVKPEIGEEFTVAFTVDGKKTEQTFRLCGWWDEDKAMTAKHILIPESRVNAVLEELAVTPPGSDNITGSWNIDVMFKNAARIDSNMQTVLERHGYQSEKHGEGYIALGVNWGYTGAKLSDSIDPATIAAILAMLLLIIFTGYLIIYNVFQISVAGDIRFYGLLKTIGTTGRQIKAIVRRQALLLSLIGIPAGLAAGWLVGVKLTPVILSRLNNMVVDAVSVSPVIFAGASLFSVFTVLLSCSRPGRLAARVSPVDAVRYTEGNGGAGAVRKGTKKLSLFRMARANLGRNKSKTVVTILSLSLAVVLLNTTVMFTTGFDMDKYLSANSASDFVIADAAYFQVGKLFSADTVLDERVAADVNSQGGITDGGRIYGLTEEVSEFVTEEDFRKVFGSRSSEEMLDQLVESKEKAPDGRLLTGVQLYGMEGFALDKLKVLEGDISRLYEPGSRYIAAVYFEDDYGNPEMDTNWAKPGESVTLRYTRDNGAYEDVVYEVAAAVVIPHSLSYRYYGSDEFILNDRTFIEDTDTSEIMLYAFDTEKEAAPAMERFLADYTQGVNPACDYESKATCQAEFESFRSMFLLLGGVLSFIVGLIGILNFINAVLTGILTRRREFAMLQSIGMTGRQLKIMLACEGLLYALGSVLFALCLSLLGGPFVAGALENMFWFFTYRFTVTPVMLAAPVFALFGCAVPLAVYRVISGRTIVERLRLAEN